MVVVATSSSLGRWLLLAVGLQEALDVLLLAYDPQHVAQGEAVVGRDDGEVFLAFVESHHHAVVPVPDAAFAQRLVEEGALWADDDLLEAHLPLLYLGVLVVDLRPHGLGEARELVVVAYHLELVAGEEGHLAVGDIDALAAAEDAAHVDAEMLAEVELRQLLASPKRVFGHLAETHVDLAVEQSALVERPFAPEGLGLDLAAPEVLDEETLEADAPFLQTAREHHQHDCAEGDGDEQRVGEARQVVGDIEDVGGGDGQSDQDGEDERGAVGAPLRPERLELLGVVLLHHEGAQEGGDHQYGGDAADGVAGPVGPRQFGGEFAAEGQGEGEHQRDDGDGEDAVDQRVDHHGAQEALPEMAGGGSGGGARADVLQAAAPLARQVACEKVVARLRSTDHVRCEECCDDGDRDYNRIEEVADDPQGEAQRRYDKGKLAHLGHGETTAHGVFQALAAQEVAHRAEEGLTGEDGEDEAEDGEGVIDDDQRIDEHADGDEEDGAEEILDRFDEADDLVGLDGLGKDAAHHKGSEGAAEAHLGGDDGHEAAEAEGNDQEGLGVHELAHLAQQQGDEEDADDEPQDEEEAYLEDAAEQLAAVGRGTVGDGGEHDHHHDGEDVLEDADAHDGGHEALLQQPHVGEGLVDDGGGGHGEHAAQEDAVHVAPAEALAHGDAEQDHAEDDGAGSDDGTGAHLEDLLDGEVEAQGEQEKHHAYLGPHLDVALIDDAHRVGHVGRDQESGYDIAQHKRLAELLEQQGDGSGHDQDQGQVAHEMGKGIDRRLAFFS